MREKLHPPPRLAPSLPSSPRRRCWPSVVGITHRRTVDDLPRRLAAAIPRLEAAGDETQTVVAGTNVVPALLVRSEPPVVLATGDTSGVFLGPDLAPVRDPDGGTVDVTYSIGCSGAAAADAGAKA